MMKKKDILARIIVALVALISVSVHAEDKWIGKWRSDPIIILNILPTLLGTDSLCGSTNSQEWQILLGTTLIISKHSILCLKY